MRLADERGLRLFRAFKACNLRLRNWSHPGEWLFAVYEYDDTYVGCVVLDAVEGTLAVANSTSRVAKRERARLDELCATHARTVV